MHSNKIVMTLLFLVLSSNVSLDFCCSVAITNYQEKTCTGRMQMIAVLKL